MLRLKLTLLLLIAVVVSGIRASESEPIIPRVNLTRILPTGGSQGLALVCVKDEKGKQDFFCELRKYKNGIEVANTSVYAKQAKRVLASFFHLVPSKIPKANDVLEIHKKEPIMTWEVSFGEKYEAGTLARSELGRASGTIDAVLTLEGALISYFYQP